MGRLMQTLRGLKTFVPNIDGNRAEPPGECFRVEIEPCNGKELRALEQAGRKKAAEKLAGNDLTFDEAINAASEIIRAHIVAERCKRVWNYGVQEEDSDEVIKPQNGAELVDAVELAEGAEADRVLDSIVIAIKRHSKLREGMLKKSGARSNTYVVPIALQILGDAMPVVDETPTKTDEAPTPERDSETAAA